MALELTQAQIITELRGHIGDSADSFADRALSRATITGLARLARRRDWSWFRDTFPCASTVPYSTGTVAINIGSTTVTGDVTVFPSTVVSGGAWIEFAGQTRAYEITVRTSDTSITIRNAYANADAANLASASYRIFYPSIDLPANFKKLRTTSRCSGVLDDGRNSDLDIVMDADLLDAHAAYASVGAPHCGAIRPKRNDPNIFQLWMYPPPNTVETYTVLYHRVPGWYSTSTVATATFTVEPVTTSYFLDWPKNHKDLYLASCKLSMAADGVKGLDYGMVRDEYQELLRAAESDDERQPEVEYLGQGNGPRRESWRIGV